MSKIELVALILLSFGFLVTTNVLCLFLSVLLVGLQCVIMVFLDYIHLRFNAATLSLYNLGYW